MVLEALEGSDRLYDHLTLARVKVRHGRESKATDDVRYDGRAVARGQSFAQHM